MIPLCVDQCVGIIPYSPLARRLLAGARTRGGEAPTPRSTNDPLADEMYADADFDVVDVVRAVASSRGAQPAQNALTWLYRNPAITAPIIGATNVRHIEDAVAALDVDLSREETARMEAPYRPHAILGHA